MSAPRRLAFAAVIMFAAVACDGSGRGDAADSSAANTATTTSLSSSTTTAATISDGCQVPPDPRADPAIQQVVDVFLICSGQATDLDLRAVGRLVPIEEDPLTAAVEQLFAGLTPEEAAAGLGSAFSTYTAGMVKSVSVDAEGVAVFDLGVGFLRAGDFPTSNVSGIVSQQLTATVFQFPEVTGIEFVVEGERWCWFENECVADTPMPLVTR